MPGTKCVLTEQVLGLVVAAPKRGTEWWRKWNTFANPHWAACLMASLACKWEAVGFVWAIAASLAVKNPLLSSSQLGPGSLTVCHFRPQSIILR